MALYALSLSRFEAVLSLALPWRREKDQLDLLAAHRPSMLLGSWYTWGALPVCLCLGHMLASFGLYLLPISFQSELNKMQLLSKGLGHSCRSHDVGLSTWVHSADWCYKQGRNLTKSPVSWQLWQSPQVPPAKRPGKSKETAIVFVLKANCCASPSLLSMALI